MYTKPCHTYTILTHSIGKLIIVILPTFPREIHGYSPHQPHLGMAKASSMLPLREEFYSCPEKYNPNHVESVTQTYCKVLHQLGLKYQEGTGPSNTPFRPSSCYAGGIWKCNFISTVKSTVHNNPSQNVAFPKRSSYRRNLKMLALRFREDGIYFENGAFRKRWRHDNATFFLARAFLKRKSKTTDDYFISCVSGAKTPLSNFSAVVWAGPS